MSKLIVMIFSIGYVSGRVSVRYRKYAEITITTRQRAFKNILRNLEILMLIPV
ncbi:MAG: hypothetical protein NZ929_02100 [Aigarchaeota archaeon]|nr:hypothetical protein [Aigarchaeota archaeon]MCX8193005.1 hypothetical protein [Nitrososphaeria archaeon]MDW7986259.1 hypothetical protein [Nitrososphaerota archaeon]